MKIELLRNNQFTYDSFVAEYSPRSGNFHVHTLGEAIDKNRSAVLNGAKPDFIPLGVYETDEAALAACDQFQNAINRE